MMVRKTQTHDPEIKTADLEWVIPNTYQIQTSESNATNLGQHIEDETLENFKIVKIINFLRKWNQRQDFYELTYLVEKKRNRDLLL